MPELERFGTCKKRPAVAGRWSNSRKWSLALLAAVAEVGQNQVQVGEIDEAVAGHVAV